jgi:hypothetical protein
MSGAAISSTMLRSQIGPQKFVNHRPTMALLSKFALILLLLTVATAMCNGEVGDASRQLLSLESESNNREG